MKLFKTLLLLLVTSVMVLAKTGYSVWSDSDVNVQPTASALENSLSTHEKGELTSFHHLHQPHDNPFLGIDLEEEEKEDTSEEKSGQNHLSCSIYRESNRDFTPHCLGSTSSFKGISQTQPIRLHLVIEKIQI